MEKKILEFYEKKVSSKGVVISKMKFIHIISNIATFIFMGIFAVPVVAWFFYQFNRENYLPLILSIIVYIVIAILNLLFTIKIYRYTAARILKNEGVLKVNPTNWSGHVFEEWQFYKVKEKLIEEDMLNPKNMERLISNLKDRLPKTQKNFFVLLSLTLAAFIPNFTLYLMHIYKQSAGQETIVFWTMNILIFVLLVASLIMFKRYKETKQEFYDNKNRMIKDLIIILENILYKLE